MRAEGGQGITGRGVANRDGLRGSWAGAADALGKTALVELEGEFVAGGSGEGGQTVVQAEDEEGGGEGAESDGGIAAFEAPKGVAADEQAGGHVAGAEAALAPGEGEVAAELAESAGGREREGVRFGHWNNVLYNRRKVN